MTWQRPATVKRTDGAAGARPLQADKASGDITVIELVAALHQAGPVSIAIQGEEGSNSATAAQRLVGAGEPLVCCESFAEVFECVESGRARAAVLPVENTTAGLIQEVWDRLLGVGAGPLLHAVAETRVRIRFVAAALKDREQVRRVLAHPVAAAQCRKFLRASTWQVVPCHDTAGAARLVKEQGSPDLAALCPPQAAERYGLTLAATEVGDSPNTWTRFLMLLPGKYEARADDDRCLWALSLTNRPGTLAHALSAFATRELNLCALHSRSVPGKQFEYEFTLELETGPLDRRCAEVLDELQSQGAQVRSLGSFHAVPEAGGDT
jgi:prephenate dehydratase